MNYSDAINASQIWAARGYDEKNICVVSVCHYGGKLMWLTGFGGNWTKTWEEMPEEANAQLEGLRFAPTGRKPDDQINAELLELLGDDQTPLDEETAAAMAEIADEYDYADEVKDDYFEPMGETYE